MNNNQSNGHINLNAGYFKHLWLRLPSWINITKSFWSQFNYTVVNLTYLVVLHYPSKNIQSNGSINLKASYFNICCNGLDLLQFVQLTWQLIG